MLSKLDQVMHGQGGLVAASVRDDDLKRVFPSVTDIEPVSGGTAGLCFKATVEGAPVFLKTQPNIAKEARVMQAAHPNLGVRLIDQWLMCPWLDQITLRPGDVLGLLHDYQPRLKETVVGDDIVRLLDYGFDSLHTLTIEDDTRKNLSLLFKDLRAALPDMKRIVCHGDLGPKNIMALNGRPVAIDWEDAFMGVEGYDYLFWHSFFSNRAHLAKLKPTKIEKALLALIVALKCELSYRLGTDRGNALSFDQRIREVLDLGQ